MRGRFGSARRTVYLLARGTAAGHEPRPFTAVWKGALTYCARWCVSRSTICPLILGAGIRHWQGDSGLSRGRAVNTGPDYSFEAAALARGALRVVGVDEVGRGPLAGPVTAAAVWLDPRVIPDGLNDSKKLAALLAECADVSIAHASVDEIAELNILRASHLAMQRAVAGLRVAPDHLLVDGNRMPDGLGLPGECVVRGDARVLSIAAASIVAKVARDRIMAELARSFPGYGWERNAGYPTPAHKRALADLGVSPHHRRTFAPVHKILYPDESVTR